MEEVQRSTVAVYDDEWRRDNHKTPIIFDLNV